MSNTIERLAEIGTTTWLDDLSRERIASGNLERMIATAGIAGVTTNPAIFATAMSTGSAYDDQIARLRERGADADTAVYAMSVEDVRAACDLFAGVYRATKGRDGRVSIEVDPRFSEDAEATVAQARELWRQVDRPNAMIKIPATEGSLSAIAEVLAEGISVNVTLIFSVERYRRVIEAYKEGIRRAAAAGRDVSQIVSVASFFVSRLDTEVDKRLEAIGTDEALALRGKAGVANARRAYALFLDAFDATAQENLPEGTQVQRPLWASTGVKNPDYPATLYVAELAGPQTVNTMPQTTIDAVISSDDLRGDTLTDTGEAAEDVFAALERVGIDLHDVFAVLEREGVEKFVTAWEDLLASMSQRL
ncbi:transaldolase [Corynebacterium sp. zg-331]|uniref:transaldolase n=1 Tax=unclassified Corynebacterium TaxID=2624378 RepID=UPI00128D05B4|nr:MULTISPECIES: transaldolase [unclassified Corynebacterium]MBC3185510.1 transaldolase [Corynebacterium sp. zg-331]MPV52004.1 transaldolase [Corynebacterium sp. zg331]